MSEVGNCKTRPAGNQAVRDENMEVGDVMGLSCFHVLFSHSTQTKGERESIKPLKEVSILIA